MSETTRRCDHTAGHCATRLTDEEVRADLLDAVTNAQPEITTDVKAALRKLPHVKAVRTTWLFGCVEIHVDLDAWDEDTWHGAHDLIDAFARPHVEQFSVIGHVHTPTRRTRVGSR